MMKPAIGLMISFLVLVSCESGKRDVKYLLTDEQLSSLMFDVQLSEVALAEVTEERQDSLRDLFWLRFTEVYKHSVPEIKEEIRKLEEDPEKMKVIMDQVQVLLDSIP
ncbi:MAG: hypothetical protein IPP25_00105 [Saprospiraceae bacterium]|nr:hypothetical protein [Candidatus Opimibacter skivensis]